ncbi:MAG: hypothetical protein HY854_18850 [Burkholderiales bacterium]|nr:hypothetical protein [Burkholderiales bacterium]
MPELREKRAAAGSELVNQLAHELARAQRSLAASQQKLLAANRSLQTRMQDLGEARATVALLLATLDACEDGVLATGHFGHAMHYNLRFLQMWRLTAERMEGLNDSALLALQLAQVRDPQFLLALVEAHHARPEEEHSGLVERTDGRTLHCLMVSHRVQGQRLGTVTTWREVPQAKNPSQTSLMPVSSMPM